MATVLFLPGAGGSPVFWEPVANRLPAGWRVTLVGWPGAGDQPHDPRVSCFDDLVVLIQARISDRCDVVAQSMGGVVAVGLSVALPREGQAPGAPCHLGWDRCRCVWCRGLAHGLRRRVPERHLLDHRAEGRLHATARPRGSADTPVVGRSGSDQPNRSRPAARGTLPNSQLRVIPGGTHDVAVEQPMRLPMPSSNTCPENRRG